MMKKSPILLLILSMLLPLGVFAQEEDGWGFVPGDRLLLFDDYSDMTRGSAPPHWKVRGAAVRLVDGRLSFAGGSSTRMTPNVAAWPDNFTIEMNVQAKPSADDAIRNVTWVFENGDAWVWQATLALYAGGSCQATVEIADPGENSRAACSWLPDGTNNVALWVQDGRLRIYLNGQRLIDMNQLRLLSQTATLMVSADALPVSFGPFRIAQSTGGAGSTISASGSEGTGSIQSGSSADASATAASGPPVGAAEVTAPALAPPGGTLGAIRIDRTAVFARVVRGGSQVSDVVIDPATGEKRLGVSKVEPIVIDLDPGTPLDPWINSFLNGSSQRRNGALLSGIVPDDQELSFSNAPVIGVTFFGLDLASKEPSFMRVTLAPETARQRALTTSTPVSARQTASQFRFSMGGSPSLETRRVVRIESLSATNSVVQQTVGGIRDTVPQPGRPVLGNILLTISSEAGSPLRNWLAWYEDFVIRGNNGPERERTFTLELLTATGTTLSTLRGSGVGVVAMRALPSTDGTVRPIQVELYVERLEIIPQSGR